MMNDGDVARQLKQMTDFIRQEAVEKAAEIEAAAAEEFQIEKLQLVEAEKKRIRLEFERNEKQGDIKKKIEYSKQLNASRLEVLQAQDDLAMSMLEAAGKELLYITRDHHVYKNLLRIFIVQSLLRLKEPSCDSALQEGGSSGGVVLASRDGKIVCENTLDARLEVVFRKKLPEIRRSLLGQVAA
ncbi:hypothetical protein OsJ_00923 [Oryza sativa Japonica Group]|uniref:V-type proton ATPase subunit E n=1 Tax=Oryza sativa subsp. japonica TaxID=39947 RepID=B9EU54_ORYSJ|nr:hypothetical protein OsJ_00923 [Oryza sativa Japonica Group]